MDDDPDQTMDDHARFTVVTYNILSSALAAPDWFTTCAPEDLVAETRLARILTKLSAETDKGAIICLQEVTLTLTPALTLQPCS